MSDYVQVSATITAPWGAVHEAEVGSMQTWAWEDRKARAPWLKVRRALLLAEHTCNPKAPGWRVNFRAEPIED